MTIELNPAFPDLDPDDESDNTSGNHPFSDVVAARLSRRSVLSGGVATMVGGFLGLQAAGAAAAAPAKSPPGQRKKPGNLLGFSPVPTSDADAFTVPDGYTTEVIIPWGQPLSSDGPAWRPDGSNTAADQEQQVGMHHDGMHFFPLENGPGGSRRGLLVLNHEYIDRTILYADGDAEMTQEKVDKALAAHGLTVVELRLIGSTWQAVDSPSALRRRGERCGAQSVWLDGRDRSDGARVHPVKRTALGRFKHEGATFTESRGRVVVYSGDDQDGDYIYKFVGDGAWKSRRARGQSPLDHGTLYVAQFDDDGTGEWLPLAFGDNTATTFEWDLFVLAGDPVYDSQVQLDETNIFGSPDGLWFDPDGRLWIQTDVSNSSVNRADRGYDNIGNNAMLAADPETGEIRRFLVGPKGCEITGVITTPDQRTMFVNVQHPGESTAAIGTPTPENPRAVSNWPDFDPDGRPRSATVVIRKDDGGVIGT